MLLIQWIPPTKEVFLSDLKSSHAFDYNGFVCLTRFTFQRERERVCVWTDWCEFWLDPTTCFRPFRREGMWSPRSPTFSLTMKTWQKHDPPIHVHHGVSQPSTVHIACGAVVTVQTVDRMRGCKMTFYLLSAVRSIHILFSLRLLTFDCLVWVRIDKGTNQLRSFDIHSLSFLKRSLFFCVIYDYLPASSPVTSSASYSDMQAERVWTFSNPT